MWTQKGRNTDVDIEKYRQMERQMDIEKAAEKKKDIERRRET